MKNKIIFISLFTFMSLIFIFSFSNILADSTPVIINENSEINKNINITLDLSLIDYDIFTFKLSSDKSLNGVESENVELLLDNQEEIVFDYNINASNLNKIVLDYKLPEDISVGDSITFYIEIINKQNEEEKLTFRKVVTIISEIKKEEKNEKEEIKNESSRQKENSYQGKSTQSNKSKGNYNFTSSKGVTKVTYPGSDNNYLKSLSVSNYSFNRKFSKDGLTYFVTVKNNVKSLKINYKLDSSKSKINISGNSNFRVGINKVLITVTSESGLSRNYRIYVIREE